MLVKFTNSSPQRQVETNQRPQPGVYKVVVDELKPGTTQSGNPKIDAKFVIAEGPHKGGRLYTIFTFSESQMNAFARFVSAARGGDLPENVDIENMAPFIGAMLLVRINHEKQGNMLYTRCRDFYLLDETALAQADVELDDLVIERKSAAAPVPGGF